MSHLFTMTELTARLGHIKIPVASWEHVSRAFRALRDGTVYAAPSMPWCMIRDATGRTVAYVSANGRVWLGHPEEQDDDDRTLLYDPLLRNS